MLIKVETPTSRPVLVIDGDDDSVRVNGIQIGPRVDRPIEMTFELPEGMTFLEPPLLWGTAPAAFDETVVVSASGDSFHLVDRAGEFPGRTFELFPLYGTLGGGGVVDTKYWFPIALVHAPLPIPHSPIAIPRFAHLAVDAPFTEAPVVTLASPTDESWITVADNVVTIQPSNPYDQFNLTFRIESALFYFPACLWTQQPTNVSPPVAEGGSCTFTFTPILPVEPRHRIFFFQFLDGPEGQKQVIDPVLTENPPMYGGEPV